jgi:lincosamide nucleotidyltransferase A/C/D/E
MPMAAEDVVDVLDRLEAAGVEASLAGGWAIDALLGRTTREHGDLDLAIDADDIDRAIDALEAAGLRIEVDERPARLALATAGAPSAALAEHYGIGLPDPY